VRGYMLRHSQFDGAIHLGAGCLIGLSTPHAAPPESLGALLEDPVALLCSYGNTLSAQGFVEKYQVEHERGAFVNHCTCEAARNNAKPPSVGNRRCSPLVLPTLVEAWIVWF